MKIKYFNQFLYESLVSDACKIINESEALDILEETIKYFGGFENIPLLYRGIRSSDDYMIQDMSNFNRVSSFSKTEKSINLHNLYLSYEDKFKNYNRRNKSVIFTNNKLESKTYGDTYLVIPLNKKAKISYVHTNDIYEIIDEPRQINEKINNFLDLLSDFNLPKLDQYTKNLDEFKDWIDYIDSILDEIKHKVNDIVDFENSYIEDICYYIKKCDSFDMFMEYYLFKYLDLSTPMSESIYNDVYDNLKSNNDFTRIESIELLTEEKCALFRLDSDILEKYIKVK